MAKGLGDCYTKHGRMMMDKVHSNTDSGWKIVHGLPTGQGSIKGVKHGHCWLEKGNIVYDYSNGKHLVIPKIFYYKIGKIKKFKKYSGKQFMKKLAETGTWGPQSSYSIVWKK